ncbi:hypothetical protein SORBI_3009G106601 [Sorghum bicolor]|uniref:Uncharacterized protein n=1 Tax=Sorghum bicolor TaxID=4558 RepID=A0A1Z5R215_SORBI|nr:hypothetical protein SORBI_3009G106601 [Sorghum bicolor]
MGRGVGIAARGAARRRAWAAGRGRSRSQLPTAGRRRIPATVAPRPATALGASSDRVWRRQRWQRAGSGRRRSTGHWVSAHDAQGVCRRGAVAGRGRRQPIAAVRRIRLLEIDMLLSLFFSSVHILTRPHVLAGMASSFLIMVLLVMFVHLPSSSSSRLSPVPIFLTAWWSGVHVAVLHEGDMLG